MDAKGGRRQFDARKMPHDAHGRTDGHTLTVQSARRAKQAHFHSDDHSLLGEYLNFLMGFCEAPRCNEGRGSD